MIPIVGDQNAYGATLGYGRFQAAVAGRAKQVVPDPSILRLKTTQ